MQIIGKGLWVVFVLRVIAKNVDGIADSLTKR